MKLSTHLVSISFPGRDLNLAPVSLKNFAEKDEHITDKYSFKISQFTLQQGSLHILNELEHIKSDIYGFSTYVWNIKIILEIASGLKERNPHCKILLGGPEAGGMPYRILEKYPFVDFVFYGEGEVPFRKFLLSKNYNDVPNLVFRRNGSIIQNPSFLPENLDEFPLPYESEEYRKYLDTARSPVRAAIETSRGCPFSCGYCSWGRKQVRYISLERLKPAFKYLLEHPNVATVYITDSNPFLKKDRAKELLTFLIEANVYKKPVTFELNPEYMNDEETLNLISKLSNEEFAFGIQSTSPHVLKTIGRNFDGELYRKNIFSLKEKNPHVEMWFSLIIGLPEDNYEQFLDSLDFVLNLEPSGIYFHELLCLPGSDFYRNPEKYGLEFMKDAPHKLLYNKTFSKNELEKTKKIAYLVYLLNRIPEFNNEIREIARERERFVDIYLDFYDFIEEKIDLFMGKGMADISTWFFEHEASEFIKNYSLMNKLHILLNNYKERLVKDEVYV